MIRKVVFSLVVFIHLILTPVHGQTGEPFTRKDIPLDSIRLSDPFILADKATATYYMTGTGGLLWKSKDLEKWTGPFRVTKTDPNSWM